MSGIKVTEISSSPSSAVSAPSAVIALIGCSPIGPVNTLTQCRSAVDDAQFGLQVPGFSIPQALSAIRANDPGANVLVVNVALANAGTRNTLRTQTNESITLVAGAGTLGRAPESSPAPVVKDATLATTYVQGTDYTISTNGAFARVGTAIGATDTIRVSYSHIGTYSFVADKATLPAAPYRSMTPILYNLLKTVTYVAGTDYTISAYGVVQRIPGGAMTAGQMFMADFHTFDGIVAADIQGTASPRTGLYQYELAYGTYGYMPTMWCAPYYTQVTGVATALASWTAQYKGIYFIDEEEGATVANVITHRGGGSGSKLDTSDERAVICYPFVDVYSPASNDTELRPPSMFLAGYQSMVDRLENGPHRSAANYHTAGGSPVALKGIEGVELSLSFHPNSELTTDISQLEAVGVVAIRPGNIFWGLKSAAFPDSTAVTGFYAVRRTADMISVSIIDAGLEFIGRPINKALIDAMLQKFGNYMSGLVQAGSIVSGKVTYTEADNPPASLALGQLTFGITIIPSIPTKQIDVNFNITVEGLAAILAA